MLCNPLLVCTSSRALLPPCSSTLGNKLLSTWTLGGHLQSKAVCIWESQWAPIPFIAFLLNNSFHIKVEKDSISVPPLRSVLMRYFPGWLWCGPSAFLPVRKGAHAPLWQVSARFHGLLCLSYFLLLLSLAVSITGDTGTNHSSTSDSLVGISSSDLASLWVLPPLCVH